MKKASALEGRIGELVAKLTEDERGRAAIKYGRRIGENATLQIWNHRKVMARTIRMQEKKSPRSEWNPIVKLTDGEGY